MRVEKMGTSETFILVNHTIKRMDLTEVRRKVYASLPKGKQPSLNYVHPNLQIELFKAYTREMYPEEHKLSAESLRFERHHHRNRIEDLTELIKESNKKHEEVYSTINREIEELQKRIEAAQKRKENIQASQSVKIAALGQTLDFEKARQAENEAKIATYERLLNQAFADVIMNSKPR